MPKTLTVRATQRNFEGCMLQVLEVLRGLKQCILQLPPNDPEVVAELKYFQALAADLKRRREQLERTARDERLDRSARHSAVAMAGLIEIAEREMLQGL